MTLPLVSVLMTAYNREKYIAEAIESVLASTFKDFELIIVDDCSKDRTVEIARRYLSDPRVQVHLNEKNLGDYPNRNCAASLARGKYLKYVDADDYIYPHGLAIMVDIIERFPDAALGLVSLDLHPKRPFPFELSPKEAYLQHHLRDGLFKDGIFNRAPLSAIIKRECFNAVGGFTGKRWVGDFELWHILAARFPVVLMPQGLVWYRIHAEQEMQNNRLNPMVSFAYGMIASEHLKKPECPLSPPERIQAILHVERGQAKAILRAVCKNQPRYAWQMFQQSGFTVLRLFKAAVAAEFRKIWI